MKVARMTFGYCRIVETLHHPLYPFWLLISTINGGLIG